MLQSPTSKYQMLKRVENYNSSAHIPQGMRKIKKTMHLFLGESLVIQQMTVRLSVLNSESPSSQNT